MTPREIVTIIREWDYSQKVQAWRIGMYGASWSALLHSDKAEAPDAPLRSWEDEIEDRYVTNSEGMSLLESARQNGAGN